MTDTPKPPPSGLSDAQVEEYRAALLNLSTMPFQRDAVNRLCDALTASLAASKAAEERGRSEERADVLAYVRSKPKEIDRWLAEYEISSGCHERMAERAASKAGGAAKAGEGE